MHEGPRDSKQIADRREFLGLIGLAIVVTACGSGPTAEAPAGQTATADGTAPSDAQVVRLPDPPGESPNLAASDYESRAERYGGRWLGSWATTDGASGTMDVQVVHDLDALEVSIAVAFSGSPIGGPAPAPAVYVFPLDLSVPASWDFASPFGAGLLDLGFDDGAGTIVDPPAAPDVARVAITGLLVGPKVSVDYQVTHRDGALVAGAAEITRGDTRPPPPNPFAISPRYFSSGEYACGLVTPEQVRDLVGMDLVAFPNGGRPGGPGPGLSNSMCWYVEALDAEGYPTGPPRLEYSVILAVDEARAAEHMTLAREAQAGVEVPGLGDEAVMVGELLGGSLSRLRVRAGELMLEVVDPSIDGAGDRSARAEELVFGFAQLVLPRLVDDLATRTFPPI